MDTTDIRWIQRFESFKKAFEKLETAIVRVKILVKEISRIDAPSTHLDFEIMKEGLIHRFEYTHELSWKVIKDLPIIKGIAQ